MRSIAIALLFFTAGAAYGAFHVLKQEVCTGYFAKQNYIRCQTVTELLRDPAQDFGE